MVAAENPSSPLWESRATQYTPDTCRFCKSRHDGALAWGSASLVVHASTGHHEQTPFLQIATMNCGSSKKIQQGEKQDAGGHHWENIGQQMMECTLTLCTAYVAFHK